MAFSCLPAALYAQDYTSYNTLVQKYASPNGVQYKTWKANARDTAALKNILTEWARIDANKLNKKQKAAFRINLYNAAMLDIVLDRYPLKSVTKIGVPFSVFKRKSIKTPQGNISLDTLEKKQLLIDFPDPRIHFAVNCASISCPPLRNEAYTAEKLENQLADQAQLFVASPHAVQIKGNSAYYSQLFDWYKNDFAESNPAKIINKYASKKIPTNLKIRWIKYDWNLNEAS
ncbi:DUF547 domain-containing protein [Rubritalea tangerina]|uniref:DUF547 domain-containing protein n=1 Tax=Rubritalea tangerina TaxID=430798 RepID=UPI003613B3A1